MVDFYEPQLSAQRKRYELKCSALRLCKRKRLKGTVHVTVSHDCCDIEMCVDFRLDIEGAAYCSRDNKPQYQQMIRDEEEIEGIFLPRVFCLKENRKDTRAQLV